MSRIRWQYDWVLVLALLCGLVVAGDFFAAALYQADQTVTYWYLLFDNYIDGAPGSGLLLGSFVCGLLLDWLALRLLARAGISFWRAWGIVILAALLPGLVAGAALGLLLGRLLEVLVVLGLCALTWAVLWRLKRQAPQVRAALLSLIMGASLVVLLIGLPLDFVVSSVRSYSHVSTRLPGGYVYHQALKYGASGPPTPVLFQCDSTGIFCQEVNS